MFPNSQPKAGCALNGLLLKAIDPSNLRLQGNRMEISLWTEWPQMLADLPALGGLLVVSHNPSAILGKSGPYPEPEFCCSLLHARSACGSFEIDFQSWNSAQAVAEERAEGFAHFIEFRNYLGDVIHKVCLTDQSRAEAFVAWVRDHQSIGVGPLRSQVIPGSRCRTIQQRHWFGIEECEEVPADSLLFLLEAAMAQQIAVRIITGNEGIVQAAEMTPRRASPSGEWNFISDDCTGLHFAPDRLGSVIIHHIPETELSVLKCFDEAGELCLSVTPPRANAIPAWNNLLRSVI